MSVLVDSGKHVIILSPRPKTSRKNKLNGMLKQSRSEPALKYRTFSGLRRELNDIMTTAECYKEDKTINKEIKEISEDTNKLNSKLDNLLDYTNRYVDSFMGSRPCSA